MSNLKNGYGHNGHWGQNGHYGTLPSQLKSQTDRGWSPAIMEVLLASCAPSVNGFSETAFLNTPCHTISRIFPSPCTWILLLWFLKKTLGQILHATQSATFFNLHVTWILLKWLLKLFPYTDQRCKKNKGEQYFIYSWLQCGFLTGHIKIWLSPRLKLDSPARVSNLIPLIFKMFVKKQSRQLKNLKTS